MTPEITPEYQLILKKELDYVNQYISYCNQKFAFLVNQNMSSHIIQEISNNLYKRKTELEIQILMIKDLIDG